MPRVDSSVSTSTCLSTLQFKATAEQVKRVIPLGDILWWFVSGQCSTVETAASELSSISSSQRFSLAGLTSASVQMSLRARGSSSSTNSTSSSSHTSSQSSRDIRTFQASSPFPAVFSYSVDSLLLACSFENPSGSPHGGGMYWQAMGDRTSVGPSSVFSGSVSSWVSKSMISRAKSYGLRSTFLRSSSSLVEE